jgi:dephospho-CoA kinase
MEQQERDLLFELVCELNNIEAQLRIANKLKITDMLTKNNNTIDEYEDDLYALMEKLK